MKILIFMGGFFPGKKYGGPPVSVDNFCSLLSIHDCYIVTHNHDLFDKRPYENINSDWNDRGNCKVLYLSDKDYNKKTFSKIIKAIKPNIIYLQGLFQECVVPCLQLAKKYNCKVLLAPRGELCHGAISIKKYKKMPYLLFLKNAGLIRDVHFQSTSEEETYAIQKYFSCPMNRIHFLDNIPSIPGREYKRENKIVGKAKFVFLSRIHPKKNLLSAIRFFKDIDGEVIFDIYGSIEDESYWNECLTAIKEMPSNIEVCYKGIVTHDQVHEIFSKYDAFLFPTLSENYGHVIAESLMVGTPVIISDQTPWTELELFGAGWAHRLSDYAGFVASINEIIGLNADDSLNKSLKTKEYVLNKSKINEIKESYLEVLQDIISPISG